MCVYVLARHIHNQTDDVFFFLLQKHVACMCMYAREHDNARSLRHDGAAAVTHYFICDGENRYHKFYLPVTNFMPNIYAVPAVCSTRYTVLSVGRLSEMANPVWDPLPLAIYSLPMRLAYTADYWDPHVIRELSCYRMAVLFARAKEPLRVWPHQHVVLHAFFIKASLESIRDENVGMVWLHV